MRTSITSKTAALVGFLAFAACAAAQGTAFIYQGRVTSGGVPAQGLHDFQFRLLDALSGGAQLGPTVCVDNVTVTDGLFSALIDFGQVYSSGGPRYIEIQVRRDTGLSCANTSGFTVLAQRQQLRPTPMAVHANSAFALDAPDGSPANVVFVDNAGNVGIGTTTPGKKLTVAGDMELGTGPGDYRHFRIGGGNCSGFLYGSYPALGDGIHMGYNYYADPAGVGRIVATDGQTSRVSMGYGYVALATGDIDTPPANRVFVATNGNVGIGTDAPTNKLSVNGEIALGPNAVYSATSGEENLRILRGRVLNTGAADMGCCFWVEHPSTGFYIIHFFTPFAATPNISLTSISFPGRDPVARIGSSNANGFDVSVTDRNGNAFDWSFNLIVVGPK